MKELLWSQGHVAWPLFSILVFSMLSLLLTDYIWRIMKISRWVLGVSSLVVWLAGVVLICILLK